MRQVIKEKLHIIFSFLIFYLIVEMIMFKWVDFGFLPKNLLIDLIIAFALASFIFLIKSTRISLHYFLLMLRCTRFIMIYLRFNNYN